MMLEKVKKELIRFKKRLFYSSHDKRLEVLEFRKKNLPYETLGRASTEKLSSGIPIIKTVNETLVKIVQNRCSLSRFGDGEFGIINGSRIHYQDRNCRLAGRLREVLIRELPNLMIGLPDCFGSLDGYLPDVADFWRKWMSRKREMACSHLDMKRVYYNAFLSRVYMQSNKTSEHFQYCRSHYEQVGKIWHGREVVICEGEETRFGMFNDLLSGAKSISRILCPARNAFDKYDEIVSAFDDIHRDCLVLMALGPTATVLAYDLCKKGFQAIDIGTMDLDYEWFLRKETILGAPIPYKYVDSDEKGRCVLRLENPEYTNQIIRKIV
jgi:glycosyltransferase family protein